MPQPFADLSAPGGGLGGPAGAQSLPAAPFAGFTPPAPQPMTAPPAAGKLPGRSLDDPADVRTAIFEQALAAAAQFQPVSSKTHTLRVVNPGYEGPERYNINAQKQAILSGGSLGRKLRADMELVDNATGAVIHRRRSTLAQVPYYTDRGTFINNGTEYTLANQMRLKPGVYTREKDNGEIEAHVNTMPGQGVPHRLFFEPDTGVFKIKLGQSSIPLAPLLTALGVPESDMRKAWGSDLATTNVFKSRGGDLGKLYSRLVRGGTAADPRQMSEEIRTALENTKIDPEVSKHTLGGNYDHISPEVLLTTTRKLLAIYNRNNPEKLQELGLEPGEQDDRDHLAFMRLLGPEDIIAERLKAGSKLFRQILWKAGRKGTLDGLAPGLLDKSVRGAILESGLGQASEGVNPAQIFEQQMRVSRMGVGGIPSADSVPESSRSVQPSHFGFIDPVSTPESSRAGVDSRLVRHLRKMPDGSVMGQFRDPRTGQTVWKQPKEIFDSVIAFPGPLPPQPGQQLDAAGQQRFAAGLRSGRIIEVPGANGAAPSYWVPAMVRGKLDVVPADKVDYQLPHMEQAFSPLPNMVPMKSGMKGQRVAMAARMLTQALSLNNGEAPLVQSGMPDEEDRSFEELYGERMGAIRAKQGGQVIAVNPDGIDVQYQDGTKETLDLAKDLPGNRKTYINQDALVKPGDTFQPGMLLAKSNYVDKNGAAALGLNARTGWMAFRGQNFEDAIVISDSFAKRANSQHMYQHPVDVDPEHDQLGRSNFAGLFPKKFTKTQLDTLDDDGIVRVGQRVEPGDPLVLMASKRQGRVGEISRAKAATWKDRSETWDHDTPGIVTDVARTKNGGILVAVKTDAPTQVGDKFSGRHGNKGVVASIVPDDEMPVGEDGKPLEVLFNPLGVISRSNPSQAVEAWLGKIAAKTGKAYKVKDFEDIDDLVAFAQQELQKHGLKDTETVIDPQSGKQIPGTTTGNTFIMKLHHMAAAKTSGRAFGAYTADDAPAKGGPEGSKTWGMLHLNALLSHGATGAIRDASLIRGQKNPDYWAAVMSGRTPPDPPVPAVYTKFVNQLRASGINPVRQGSRTHVMAMTNADVNRMTEGRELSSPETVDWRSDGLQPITGGLFDEKLFGGAQGGRWAKITLAEPMLNPVMEEPARRLLGLTKDQLHDVIAGREELLGRRGPEALKFALSQIDVPHEITRARQEIASGTITKRDAAVRRLGYLLGSQKTGVNPADWVWDAVPVLPPRFRPISRMQGSGSPMVSDANYLYRDLFELNKNLKDNKDAFDDVGDERLAVYNAVKAVAGLGDPVAERTQEQGIKGILKHVLGHSPKNSVMQRRLLGSTTDLVGRSTIIPNADLDMDEVGIPETQAWKVYQPFIIRHLAKRGMPASRAAELVTAKHKVARDALLSVMDERPIMIDRAPVLHRYGVMAFWPRLTKSENLETSPIVIKGFGGDYDGDAMQYHVPASDDAVRDAIQKMMPSKNLLAASDFKAHYTPSQEYLGGLYAGSTAKSNAAPLRFKTRAEALKAIRSGHLDPGQAIEIERTEGD